jgi:hypothetical protein
VDQEVGGSSPPSCTRRIRYLRDKLSNPFCNLQRNLRLGQHRVSTREKSRPIPFLEPNVPTGNRSFERRTNAAAITAIDGF